MTYSSLFNMFFYVYFMICLWLYYVFSSCSVYVDFVWVCVLCSLFCLWQSMVVFFCCNDFCLLDPCFNYSNV